MADLFALSERMLSEGILSEPANRITHELSELTDRIAMVEAFSHSIVFKTDDGLLVFDTSSSSSGLKVVEAIRTWSSDKFNCLIYSHGHLDHIGGCSAFVEDAKSAGAPAPRVVAQENVLRRFQRYDLTSGYNRAINVRQFHEFPRMRLGGLETFLPEDLIEPQVTYRDRLSLTVGGLELQLHHALGETDDHTWAWIPEHKAICSGDFFIWNFPNAGNPQKVQRYPVEWATTLRDMAAMGAEILLPSHGLPIRGRDRIREVLEDVAAALEALITDVLKLMNEGARLNDIIHSIKVDKAMLAKPYLTPFYDEPEFIVNNLWRLYGGWYDGNPANLKPAGEVALAQEIASLAGGIEQLAKRAMELSTAGEHRLACHLAEMAAVADPENFAANRTRARVYAVRIKTESSLMAKGIFRFASDESVLRLIRG